MSRKKTVQRLGQFKSLEEWEAWAWANAYITKRGVPHGFSAENATIDLANLLLVFLEEVDKIRKEERQ